MYIIPLHIDSNNSDLVTKILYINTLFKLEAYSCKDIIQRQAIALVLPTQQYIPTSFKESI